MGINFNIHDLNNNIISSTPEDTYVQIKGTVDIQGLKSGINIYCYLEPSGINAGYGVSDISGNFTIPIYISGVDLDKTINIKCVAVI